MRPLIALDASLVLLLLGSGCATQIGPVTVRPLNGGRQFVLKNETGQDLSGSKTRGHLIWAGQLYGVPVESIQAWPPGAEIQTINFRYPVSVLILHGFSPVGRFSVKWEESSRVLFDGMTIGRTAFDAVVDTTPVEFRVFGK